MNTRYLALWLATIITTTSCTVIVNRKLDDKWEASQSDAATPGSDSSVPPEVDGGEIPDQTVGSDSSPPQQPLCGTPRLVQGNTPDFLVGTFDGAVDQNGQLHIVVLDGPGQVQTVRRMVWGGAQWIGEEVTRGEITHLSVAVAGGQLHIFMIGMINNQFGVWHVARSVTATGGWPQPSRMNGFSSDVWDADAKGVGNGVYLVVGSASGMSYVHVQTAGTGWNYATCRTTQSAEFVRIETSGAAVYTSRATGSLPSRAGAPGWELVGFTGWPGGNSCNNPAARTEIPAAASDSGFLAGLPLVSDKDGVLVARVINERLEMTKWSISSGAPGYVPIENSAGEQRGVSLVLRQNTIFASSQVWAGANRDQLNVSLFAADLPTAPPPQGQQPVLNFRSTVVQGGDIGEVRLIDGGSDVHVLFSIHQGTTTEVRHVCGINP